MIYICTKFHENIFMGLKLQSRNDFHRKSLKVHNSAKSVVELQLLFSAQRLMVIYICTKFRENIFDGIKIIERTGFSFQKFQRLNSAENVGGVTTLNLCISSDGG